MMSNITGIKPKTKRRTLTFKIKPRFKKAIEIVASRENRSLTNMIETLILNYCKQNDIYIPLNDEE